MLMTKNVCEEALKIMYNDEFKDNFRDKLRTRIPLFSVKTLGEKRFLQFVDSYARVNGYEVHVWDCVRGLVHLNSGDDVAYEGHDENKTPAENILHHIIDEAELYTRSRSSVERKRAQGCRGVIYILMDIEQYMYVPEVIRLLKMLNNLDSIVSSVLLSNDIQRLMPDDMKSFIKELETPAPNDEEVKRAIDDVAQSCAKVIPPILQEVEDNKEMLIKKYKRPTLYEVQIALSENIVRHKKFV